jgi:hypothetical protein
VSDLLAPQDRVKQNKQLERTIREALEYHAAVQEVTRGS